MKSTVGHLGKHYHGRSRAFDGVAQRYCVANSHGKEVKSRGIRSNDRYPLWQVRFFNDIKQPSMAFLSSMNPLFLVPARISFGWIEVPKVLKHRTSITKIKTNEVSLIQSESGLDETDIIANDTCASSERRFTLHSISQIQHFNTGNIHYSISLVPQKFDGPSCSLVCRSSRLITQISSPLHRSSVLCGG
jgi:hypothetical protein